MSDLVFVIDDLESLPEVEEKTEVSFTEDIAKGLGLEPGERAYLYPNGDLRNWRGHWIKKPPPEFGSAPSITPDSAPGMGRKGGRARHERTQAFMREKMVEKVKKRRKLTSEDPAEAYAYAAVEIFDEVLSGKGDISERRLFLQWFGVKADLIPGNEGGIVINTGGGAFDNVPPEAMRLFANLLPFIENQLGRLLKEEEIAIDNNGNQELLPGSEVIDVC